MASPEFTIDFRAPALPQPLQEYDRAASDQFNNVLRLYFNQLDEALRESAAAHNSSEALIWFMS
tara:strand:- start:207 stop:398 length:192 start_codon:yes stop_codon:yes gene_type:complete